MERQLEAFIRSEKKKYLFGAGQQAVNCLYLFHCLGVEIHGILVSQRTEEHLQSVPVYQADESEEAKEGMVLLAIGEEKQQNAAGLLNEWGYASVIPVRNWEDANFELKKLFFLRCMKKYDIDCEREWINIGSLKLRNPILGEKKYSVLFYGTELTDIILPVAFEDLAFVTGGLYEIPECCISENDVVWDIGAGIGGFSLAARTKSKAVCAVEASPVAFDYLKQNTFYDDKISCFNYVAGNQNGMVKFYDRQEYCKYSTVEPVSDDKYCIIEKEQIMLDNLAGLAGKPVNYLKINTAGGEERVLLGAVEVIRKYHPKIVVALEKVTNKDNIRLLIENIDNTYNILFRQNRLYAI